MWSSPLSLLCLSECTTCLEQDSRILTIGRALYNVSASGIAVFVNTGLLSPSLTISGDHGVTFHAPPMIHVSSRFQLRIQRTRASGDDFKDDWIGLMKVGQPNECETTCVVDIDALEASGSATDFTFEWPADRLPTSPGTVHCFRLEVFTVAELVMLGRCLRVSVLFWHWLP